MINGERQGWSSRGVGSRWGCFLPFARWASGSDRDAAASPEALASAQTDSVLLAPPCWRTAFTGGDRQRAPVSRSVFTLEKPEPWTYWSPPSLLLVVLACTLCFFYDHIPKRKLRRDFYPYPTVVFESSNLNHAVNASP